MVALQLCGLGLLLSLGSWLGRKEMFRVCYNVSLEAEMNGPGLFDP